MTDEVAASIWNSVPEGILLKRSSDGVFVIINKRSGMGCMNTFLIVWLTIWTVGCIFLLREYLSGGKMNDGDPMPLWFVLVFWGAEIIVGAILVYALFCRKTFRVDQEKLVVETGLLGINYGRTVPRDSVQKLVQMKDGGEGDDSFPSWGLKLKSEKTTTLIHRQPYDKSLWLGQFLAAWANVGFTQAPEE